MPSPADGPLLPVHPHLHHPRTGAPLQALGVTRAGRPIWPVLGASDDDTDDPGDVDGGGQGDDVDPHDDDAGDVDDTDGVDQLGDKGKRALDSMKGRWKSERDRRKAVEAELAQLRAAQGGEDATDPDTIRQQARDEARREVLAERALDRIEARAARLFADPEDARALLAAQVTDYLDGDRVDVDAIDEALSDLLTRKPHLAAAGARRRPAPDPSQGARGGREVDLDTQISEAQKAGDVRRVIRLQKQKLTTQR